jgi:hypothetical protein
MGGRVNSISVDVDHHQKNIGSSSSTAPSQPGGNGTPMKGRWGVALTIDVKRGDGGWR